MIGLKLPLWLYWSLAGAGLLGASIFSLMFDFSTLERGLAQRLLFIVWGGPLTLVIASTVVTFLKRSPPS